MPVVQRLLLQAVDQWRAGVHSFGDPVEDQKDDTYRNDPCQHQCVLASFPLDGRHQSMEDGEPTLQRLRLASDSIEDSFLLSHGDGDRLRLVYDIVRVGKGAVYGAPFPQECIVSIGVVPSARRGRAC
mmetsp:Transcript_9083/g.32231  ORF Transcript_9083/g.32231 Transcript_9083/m.32231 type:complete len:128 (-) Transcript_9083:382-765(-)|eukprot:CAMPEP_0113923782 /NCGR_PEP_ID=MMETSP1159-20121227/2324_1 /TAXON_ID=88271 /ORGANISM="Picocystis salinarum" /LENGTH=127 /DNA_ID=CAMNT_0000923969 /DNA_START=171 /DNA_END=554 /DNA_ORIENTATION=- /assembly_acc=CAM_ASM_000767